MTNYSSLICKTEDSINCFWNGGENQIGDRFIDINGTQFIIDQGMIDAFIWGVGLLIFAALIIGIDRFAYWNRTRRRERNARLAASMRRHPAGNGRGN